MHIPQPSRDCKACPACLQRFGWLQPPRRLLGKQPAMSQEGGQSEVQCCDRPCENTSLTTQGVWSDGKDNEKGRFRCGTCNRYRKAMHDADFDKAASMQFKTFSPDLQDYYQKRQTNDGLGEI